MKQRKLQWKCVTSCGACCRLAPNERTEALEALNDQQREIYMKMVGNDGWCLHYDKSSRTCQIYENRPEFCKVSSLKELFANKEIDGETFAIQCCRQQIRSIYGGRSPELKRFERNLRNPKEA